MNHNNMPEAKESTHGQSLGILILGALGVVYGDIGTSPLYALKEAFSGIYSISTSHDNVLGILSLTFWALTFVVVIKYMTFIMHADNRGEGGILALLAIMNPSGVTTMHRRVLVLVGLFGAALLYGDGVITPAISVLSAVEGLEIATPALAHFVVPITIVILVILFLNQKHGTSKVGMIFGPIMLVWFFSIALTGVLGIMRHPEVLSAVNPFYAANFFAQNGKLAFFVLGAVILTVTGAEALYADMGHFGRKPIRWGWYAVVFPALTLNYFGQGALILTDPSSVRNPFYELVPQWGLYPMVFLATLATIIASQALISGSFSLTQQAVQLGYLPRITIRHTSEVTAGQIYIPEVNAVLMLSCIALVLAFKSSSNLAAAYGMAVIGTMMITSLLFYFVTRDRWKWGLGKSLSLALIFLLFEIPFLFANLVKLVHGGWFPIVVASFIFILMTTWKTGRKLLTDSLAARKLPINLFLEDIAISRPLRVSGTAVFMTGNPEGVPTVLLHHLKHNKVLHDQVILLSITTEEFPRVQPEERVNLISLGHGIFRITARYGFMETPNIPDLLERCRKHGLEFKMGATTFFLGRETLIPTSRKGMYRWRKKIFSFMSRNAISATAYFGIPPGQVVELGLQVEV